MISILLPYYNRSKQFYHTLDSYNKFMLHDFENCSVLVLIETCVNLRINLAHSFQTCKYLLQVTSASSIQSSEMLVVQNSSNAFNTEYSQINSGLNLVDFTTDVNNSNVRLLGNSSFISCSVKLIRTLI